MNVCSDEEDPPSPGSWVTIVVKERVQRIIMWLNQNFLLTEDLENNTATLNVTFISLRLIKYWWLVL